MGKAALARKDYAAACGHFQASLKTDFALGTLLNLALCHEAEGKLASAWSEFRQLEDRAARATPPQTDRAEFAHERAEALRPRLSRLRLLLAPETKALAKLAITIDGNAVERSLYEAGVPVDPGRHEIAVGAPGRQDWTDTVMVAGEQQSVAVDVPALQIAVAPVRPVQVDLAEADRIAAARARRTAGFVVGGVGALSLGAGLLFGALALGEDDDAVCASPCYTTEPDGSPGRALASARDAYDRQNTYGWVSNVGIGVGLAALGVGTYLVLTSPKTKARARFTPTGMVVEGWL